MYFYDIFSTSLDNVALSTSAMREEELEAKISLYDRCVIRLHISHNYILQAVFRPKETGASLFQLLWCIIEKQLFISYNCELVLQNSKMILRGILGIKHERVKLPFTGDTVMLIGVNKDVVLNDMLILLYSSNALWCVSRITSLSLPKYVVKGD